MFITKMNITWNKNVYNILFQLAAKVTFLIWM